MKLRERAERLKCDIPALFLALRRRDTPLTAKVVAAITIVYALSPVDLIPDFIPVLGYLDDLIILPALIALTVRLIPRSVFDECRSEAAGMRKDASPKKWYCAIPFVLIWTVVIFVIVKAIIK